MITLDLPQAVIAATVELQQRQLDGRSTVGTGFLVSAPTPDGRPRIVLVTANHVFQRMEMGAAKVGYRIQTKDGWRYAPQSILIRDLDRELWRRDEAHDVAVIEVKAPEAFAKAAIPLAWLAGEDAFAKSNVGPGDEMMVLGFPQGLAANTAGFPILRSGRVASPIEAVSASPTFLLDFRVFPGNSGGPVFLVDDLRHANDPPMIAGMLTQQVEQNDERLEIGIVTDAQFIRDAIAQLDNPAAEPAPAHGMQVQANAGAGSDVAARVGEAAFD